MVHDIKIATGFPQQKEIIFCVKMIFLLVVDQRLSLRSTEIPKILTKLHFLKKIFYMQELLSIGTSQESILPVTPYGTNDESDFLGIVYANISKNKDRITEKYTCESS